MVNQILTLFSSLDSKTLAEQWVINDTTLLMFITGEYADIHQKTDDSDPNVMSTKLRDKKNGSSNTLNHIPF